MSEEMKRKRGRPKKVQTSVSSVSESFKREETLKRRGRPKKSEATAAAPVSETKSTVSVKKPGRKLASAKTNGATNTNKPDTANKAQSSKEIQEKLQYKVNNAWENPHFKKKAIFEFSEQYKKFINAAKTEREFVREAVAAADKKGFENLDTRNGKMLKPGDKVYRVVKNKLMMLAVIGENPMTTGTNIVGAHIDSPRIDVKQNPLYESTDMVFLKTHYYGGIKKYQWLAIPLALHGVVVLENGKTVEIRIGEKEDDPIFTITDLLPHLAKDQYAKVLSEAFSAEAMNLLIGSAPDMNEDTKDLKDKFKLNILRYLNTEYGMKEEDFLSAELEIVPAFKAKDLGLDRSMIGAYGHDDRVCAYPSLYAIFEVDKPDKTAICILTDKEEIGSVGNTGAESRALENFMADLCALTTDSPYSDRMLRVALDKSKMLSTDVSAAVDPNFEGTHDKLNASYLGKGLSIMKYSGARGKSGASDAHAEFMFEIRDLMNKNHISWQTTELGAVDKGGGGTIAMMIANLGVDVIDVGVPVLSMHAPFEVVSKVDLFMAYKAYIAFLKA